MLKYAPEFVWLAVIHYSNNSYWDDLSREKSRSTRLRHEQRLKEWLKANGLIPDSITFFLRNEFLTDDRKRAVTDLKLPN